MVLASLLCRMRMPIYGHTVSVLSEALSRGRPNGQIAVAACSAGSRTCRESHSAGGVESRGKVMDTKVSAVWGEGEQCSHRDRDRAVLCYPSLLSITTSILHNMEPRCACSPAKPSSLACSRVFLASRPHAW